KDLKSLGLAISMIFLLLGEALKDIPGVSSNLAGSLLFIAAFIMISFWIMADLKTKKEENN
ncbi:MAG: hypothetical protein ACTSVC_12810, partial [Promethearchaeota archaeon]